jgi:transposase
MKCIRIGIDTSKAVFTLHGVDETEQPILRRNLSRTLNGRVISHHGSV